MRNDFFDIGECNKLKGWLHKYTEVSLYNLFVDTKPSNEDLFDNDYVIIQFTDAPRKCTAFCNFLSLKLNLFATRIPPMKYSSKVLPGNRIYTIRLTDNDAKKLFNYLKKLYDK